MQLGKLADFIPDEETESAVLVRAEWNTDGDFPYPKFEPTCRECGREVQIKHLRFFERPDSSHPYRCDVAVKCRYRGDVWVYGVMVPERMYRKHIPEGLKDSSGQLIVEKLYELPSLRVLKRMEQFMQGGAIIAGGHAS